jgi:DNA repair exonuclease SbcCD ATPase subunit
MSEHETAGQGEAETVDIDDKLPGTVKDLTGLRQQKVQARISRLQQDLTVLETELMHRQAKLSDLIAPDEVKVRDEQIACATLDESRARLDVEINRLDTIIAEHTAKISELRELQAKVLRERENVDASKVDTIRHAASAHPRIIEARNQHAKNTAGLLKSIERARRRLATALGYNSSVS